MHLLTFIRLLHLLGLIMGLGGAVLLDVTIFTRGVIRPISRYTIHQVETLSHVVTWGLVLLWTTGLGLIWLNFLEKPEYLTNQKLWAKLAIVVVLTVNGVFIHHKVLPILKERLGKRMFDSVSRPQIALLTLIGSISFVSWATPFVLGKASEFNYVTPMALIIAVYFAVVLAVWLGLFAVMSSIAAIQRAFIKLASLATQQNAAWENAENFIPARPAPLRVAASRQMPDREKSFDQPKVYANSKY